MISNKDYTHTERRGGLIILTVSIIVILFLVITGLCVTFTLQKNEANIILFVLIGLVLIVAAISFALLEIQRREAQKQKDQAANELVRQMYEQQIHQSEVNANDGNSATWALKGPWRYSNRTTVKM